MPVPRPLSLGVVLCPDVAETELSLPRGAWLCAEAIPLEISNAVAANMAEYFLITAKRRKTASVPRFVVDVIPSARARRFPPA